MKEFLSQAWQVTHSWATNKPVLFILMNIMIAGILAASAKLRGKTTDAEGGTGTRQASLFTRVMSRTFSGRNFNYDSEFQKKSTAPADNDYRETQYEDGGSEAGYEVQEENHGETREEEEEKDKSLAVMAEIQEVQQKPPQNEKPSLSRRTRQSSRMPPDEASSGEMVTLSASSGEIAEAAPSSSTKKVRLPAPPIPGVLRKSGSFLSSFVSFGRGSDRDIPPSTDLGGAPRENKKQGEIQTQADTTTEVDTEAEDFIRKFRKDLRLQRLQSMLQRGK